MITRRTFALGLTDVRAELASARKLAWADPGLRQWCQMEFDVQRWRECWREYAAWAEKNDTRDKRDFGAILRDLDWLYQLFPAKVRTTDPDPEKLGIQNYYRILAAHDRIRNRS